MNWAEAMINTVLNATQHVAARVIFLSAVAVPDLHYPQEPSSANMATLSADPVLLRVCLENNRRANVVVIGGRTMRRTAESSGRNVNKVSHEKPCYIKYISIKVNQQFAEQHRQTDA